MLAQLAIRDIVLIDRLDLTFGAGLAALTGETGAGKSILLDAFALALGGRGDGGLVRSSQSQGQVTAVFDLPSSHPARLVAQANDIAVDGDLILRRVQMADGRTRAFVNDQPVSVQALKAIGASLVEIHGQHDERAMTEPDIHRQMLDMYGALLGDAAEVGALWAAWSRTLGDLDRARARVAQARKEVDYLRHAAKELADLGVAEGEEQELADRRQVMMQSEKVVADLAAAHEGVAGQGSPAPDLSAHLRRLQRRAQQAPALVEPSVKALDLALTALDEASTALEAALRACEFDPRELERTEERLFALRAASRKFGQPVDALPALARRFAEDLALIDAGEEQIKGLEAQADAAAASYRAAADRLSERRRAVAARLDAAVMAELPPLKLERAIFTTQITSDREKPAAAGIDTVEFWVQTNPGTRPGPIMKVASGGELSRFMLALKVVLADQGSAPTLIFDEIDTGVGGAVADAIGERLARLGARLQVVCVTHAPQVAAKAATHFLIAKHTVDAERVATRVELLEGHERREELARMLAGATITDEARAAAARLLGLAGR